MEIKSPGTVRLQGWCQNNKLLQLVSRHSQTVCYIHKRTLETLAIDVAEVVGLAVVASAELMIKPAAGFSKIVLCEISPINVLVHVIEYLTHCCLLIFFFICVLHNLIIFTKALDASRTEGSQIVLFMYFIFMYHETKSI